MNKKDTKEIQSNQSVIFYELNEMPPKVLKYFIKNFPNSNFSKIYKKSAFFKTIVNEDRHLHPWSIWPSVHRGVSSKKHQINFINQDKANCINYPPLWEIISKSNKKVGVHGTLQSYPPLINKNIKFYLPDTFAPDSLAYPRALSQLQEFNLYIVKVSQGIQQLSIIKTIGLLTKILLSRELRLRTFFKIVLNYIQEKMFKKYKYRRSIFQSSITFDSYIKNLKLNKPVFSSYFTNHLAGMMHRYWKDLFSESFNDPSYNPSIFNKNSIIKAIKEADKHIGKLIKYADKNNSNLLIISGMGQDKRIREKYLGELQIYDFQKLNKTLFKKDINLCRIVPAMLPDICITVKDKKKIDYVLNKFKEIKDNDSNPIFEIPYPPVLNTINLSLKLSKRLHKEEEVIIASKKYNLEQIGFKLIKRDQGTAYHIPEGILIWYSSDNQKLKKLASKNYIVDILEIAPAICKLLNIKIPQYMIKDSSLIKSI